MQKNKKEIKKILEILEKTYPNSTTALKYKNTFELLIAVMLSAQTTDNQVNKVTPTLFSKFKTPEDFAKLKPEELEKYIKGVGLYKTKSKNIINTCKMLLEKYNGKIPETREELIKLPGVGRKTANVMLSVAFGKDAIAVDTHVFRVANRIGLANSKNVKKTEEDLMKNIPQELWRKAHHWLIYHGRNICKARNPECKKCPIKEYCEYYKKNGGV
ncbi:DNA-(apurinic or apyrimidinic site) lyase /endonuclease III [Marinitoga hydrogenitolerans DSM 16785]|uniref:Endonuclease III n=1 Tax=Marinitoga hydrogenitolerans (strain DSM 16785 / JCM 12826 / AT1271) TaxID=1122195 RepID=A0A1M4ZD47_MARH1|nr:endonuclease III [Marinitoga hydrogenitolerans]SHF15506.1 DNA-(apurinic or apyrimidinic site) lyase /endonuclease III [Marinitoga hydrogenitolerans DSM 16785]